MHVIKSCAQPVPEVKKSGRIIADIFYWPAIEDYVFYSDM